MFKKNTIIFIVLLFSIISSCEKDDICLEYMTPNLVIRFYDNNQTDTVKEVNELTIIALPIKDTIYKNVKKDSISLALDVNNDFSTYVFISGNNTDTLKFTYLRKDIFVSKSCGYKTFFEQLDSQLIIDTDNWIKNTEIIESKITVDTLAHVKIYH